MHIFLMTHSCFSYFNTYINILSIYIYIYIYIYKNHCNKYGVSISNNHSVMWSSAVYQNIMYHNYGIFCLCEPKILVSTSKIATSIKPLQDNITMGLVIRPKFWKFAI